MLFRTLFFFFVGYRIVLRPFRTRHPSGSRLIRISCLKGRRDLLQSRSPCRTNSYKPLAYIYAPENLRSHAMSIWFVIKPCGSMSNPLWIMAWAKQQAKHICMAYILRIRQSSNQACGLFPVRNMVHCRNHLLSKCLLGDKYLLIFHYVITCPRQLMGNCLYRNYFIRL